MRRSSLLRILPLAVNGNSSTAKNLAGILNRAMRPSQKLPSADALAGRASLTAAPTASP